MADIYCNACDTRVGWKYVEAYEDSQKYKEGKFILEKAMIVKEEELRRREDEERRRMLDDDAGEDELEDSSDAVANDPDDAERTATT